MLVYAERNVLTKRIIIGTARPLALFSALALAATGCSRGADSKEGSTPPAQSAQVPNPEAPIMLRGAVVSVSASKLVLKSDTGVVTVTLAQPFQL